MAKINFNKPNFIVSARGGKITRWTEPGTTVTFSETFNPGETIDWYTVTGIIASRFEGENGKLFFTLTDGTLIKVENFND